LAHTAHSQPHLLCLHKKRIFIKLNRKSILNNNRYKEDNGIEKATHRSWGNIIRGDFYIDKKDIKYLFALSIFIGLACSFKINAIYFLVLPVVLVLINVEDYLKKVRLLILVILFPLGIFIITNPYAILSWDEFYRDVVYEYYHYKNRSLTNHSDPTSKTK
jgi:hypothetical protein